jgi:predicted SprT family Zn-dependent metalloprotease
VHLNSISIEKPLNWIEDRWKWLFILTRPCVDRTIKNMKTAITTKEYRSLQDAFDHLNRELFSNSLPQVLITLQRLPNAKGYFAADRMVGRSDGTMAHELAMNPDIFTGRTDEQIVSTLAHELVHLWQHEHGIQHKRQYHDKEWSAKMVEIGLQPSHTGQPGGKVTGQKMTHYITPDGAYSKSFGHLLGKGWKLEYQSLPVSKKERAKKNESKTKYVCPECGLTAWAKPNAPLACAECAVLLLTVNDLMLHSYGKQTGKMKDRY